MALREHRMRKLGDISYGAYLMRLPILIYVTVKLDLASKSRPVAFLIATLFTVPLAFAYGYLSARFLEQPIRRWARKYGRGVSSDREAPT